MGGYRWEHLGVATKGKFPLWALLVTLLIGVVCAIAIVVAVQAKLGRTPSSDFLREVVGEDQVVLDRRSEGGGSSESDTRTVVIKGEPSAETLLDRIHRTGGWSRLGDGLERDEDGLCVVAYDASEYLAETTLRHGAVHDALRHHEEAVVVRLVYC